MSVLVKYNMIQQTHIVDKTILKCLNLYNCYGYKKVGYFSFDAN